MQRGAPSEANRIENAWTIHQETTQGTQIACLVKSMVADYSERFAT